MRSALPPTLAVTADILIPQRWPPADFSHMAATAKRYEPSVPAMARSMARVVGVAANGSKWPTTDQTLGSKPKQLSRCSYRVAHRRTLPPTSMPRRCNFGRVHYGCDNVRLPHRWHSGRKIAVAREVSG